MRRLLWTLAVLLPACGAGARPYPDEIAAWRADKDQFMRTSAQSPVLPGQRGGFPPLPYFPIDEAYRVPASLTETPDRTLIEMSTSDGKTRQMRRVGALQFTLKGEALTLTAFADVDDRQLRRLFVPFGDATNGIETYQGGRYLDLDRTATAVYDLDFNRAYHPFCVFNPAYICPIPPKENRLKVPVRAGEKLASTSRVP
jgi:uncharacterized protein (DUF1684 family)